MYEGEKFLLDRYNDRLYNKESVKHSGTKSDNKYELVRKYFLRLEGMEKAFDREKTGAADFLKNRFYDKYVIKEKDIPDSYYESLKRIDLELGKGYTEFTDFEKHEKAMNIIDSQKNRLDKWLNYLLKENTSYPMWARYWAFQGMVKLGQFNKDTGSFTRRSKGTVAPFPDLNAEALAKTIATVVDYQNGEDVDDEKLKELIKSGNFGKIYGYNIWKLLEDEKKYLETKVDTTDGIWKEYENGSHQQVVKDLEGKVTGWCIQEESVALGYLENGKLHVYYTKDKNGDYSIPRICIRQNRNKIAEVRGVASDQNLEPEMVEIADLKLDEFPDKEDYKQSVSDMKKLTEVYGKFKLGKKLTKDEMKFVLEIERPISGFGWTSDPRIKEIANTIIIDSNNISIFEGIKEIEKGSLLKNLTSAEGLESVESIYGHVDFSKLTSAKGLENLKYIYGKANFGNLTSAKGLENLEIVHGVNFGNLTNAKGLESLSEIDGDADFGNLTSAKGLENLKSVSGTAKFSNLKNSKGLNNLEVIGGSADFSSLINAEGLDKLEKISGSVIFSSLKNSKGLNNLKSIEGSADFENLTIAKDFENLEKISGLAGFPKLKNSKGLNKLKFIGQGANFGSLINAEGLESLTKIVGNANFAHLESAKGLENLTNINGDANFSLLSNAEGLKNLNAIDGNVKFSNLKSAKGLENLTNIPGTANFSSLKDSDGLDNLSYIAGEAKFSKLVNAKSLEKLNFIGQSAYFNKLIDSEGLESLKTIGGCAVFQNLTNAKGLKELEKVDGYVNFEKLKNADGLEKLHIISGDAYFPSLVNSDGLRNLEVIDKTAYFGSLKSSSGLKKLVKIGDKAHFESLKDGELLFRLNEIGGDAYFPLSGKIKVPKDLKINGTLHGNLSRFDTSELVKQKNRAEEKKKLNRAKEILIANYKKQGLTDAQIEEQLNKLPKHLR